jgi:BirA family transcriptional regulator, biotin operon repressor / biotin---[acetyl-CoA-carboxylase] ligase
MNVLATNPNDEVRMTNDGRITNDERSHALENLRAAVPWLTRVEHHKELGSTQDRARVAAEKFSLGEALLVVADRQTAGRGRGNNEWWTGEGALAASLLFDPAVFGLPRRAIPQVSLVTGVAVVDAIAPLVSGHVLGLHWPNDVYASNRKLAGILVDVLPDGRHIIGVGINTNNALDDAPGELRERAATLHWLTGRVWDHGELLEIVLEHLASGLSTLAREPEVMGKRYNELCLQHGDVLTVRNGEERTTGRCAGIAADGALLLDTPQGRRAVYSGTLR